MKLAVLQFSADLGCVHENIARADSLIQDLKPEDVDMLVLPEMAFTGYNHTLFTILPLLEPTCDGVSTEWARKTAAKYQCIVTVGYPERCIASNVGHEDVDVETGRELAYNSTVTVASDGEIIAHYRKTHLYMTDEAWATESPEKWLVRPLPFKSVDSGSHEERVTFGICMDLNPYKFTAPWDLYEFCMFALQSDATMLSLSMAWLSSLPSSVLREAPEAPDMDTFQYWINRLMPLLNSTKDVIVVCANRTGEEPGANPCGQVEEGVRYAGTSWIGKIGCGKVSVWGLLGRQEEGILCADTNAPYKSVFHLASTASYGLD